MGKNSHYAIFSYEYEEAGIRAAEEAVAIVNDYLHEGRTYNIDERVRYIRKIADREFLGPSTNAIVKEAEQKGIPYRVLFNGKFIVFGHGINQKRVEASILETTSTVGVDLASHKEETKKVLDDAFIPVPKGRIVYSEDELEDAAYELGWPLAAKPLDGHHGEGVTVNINDLEQLTDAFYTASGNGSAVIVEKFIKGDDYRVLVIGYKFAAAAKRTPANITGDGRSTIAELIEKVNSDTRRSGGHNNVLTKIEIDDVTTSRISASGYTFDSILKKGEQLILKDTANISTGGTATDFTDEVHPANRYLAERIAGIMGLDVCGIDLIAPDLSTPLTENGGAIIEVNAAPGLRMHLFPSNGPKRNVAKAIIDYMYKDAASSRIPIIAITGTNGKTTTSRLMATVTAAQGYHVGYTTTDGIYVGEKLIASGDFTGPKSTQVVLSEPFVDYAVLECARGGIVRSGLGFDMSEVAIVTNVAADHLGLKDIDTLEDLARVKMVVPKSVKRDGFAVLNADDDLVYKMQDELECNIALFSLDPKSARIKEHVADGGVAAVLKGNKIVVRSGKVETVIADVTKMAITVHGKADFMIQNVMAVILAAYVQGFDMEKVSDILHDLEPSAEQTPGRLNFFKFQDFEVIVDYAHNPHSFRAFGKMLEKMDCHKTGIITGVGDRRDQDIEEIGRAAAFMYDEVIIRIDEDPRGRSQKEISSLVIKGIKEINPDLPYKVIPRLEDALKYAIEHARKNSCIVITAEKVKETVRLVKQIQRSYAEI